MNKRRWSARIVARYALFQVPAVVILFLILLLARRWVDIPAWFFWGLVALWVAKDVILFPFTWRAYERKDVGRANSMIGARGIAEDRLAPSGYIRIHGELWQGEVMGGGPPIDRGGSVRVRKIRNLTLLVQPDNEESTE
jgi:membrane protein implicated in regulation of membrane protease activity